MTFHARFKNALAAAGLSQNAWARLQGVSPASVSIVLSGKGTSRRIIDAAEVFIAQHSPAKEGTSAA